MIVLRHSRNSSIRACILLEGASPTARISSIKRMSGSTSVATANPRHEHAPLRYCLPESVSEIPRSGKSRDLLFAESDIARLDL